MSLKSSVLPSLALAAILSAQTGPEQQLRLEATIVLPDVQGRIDHLALDVDNRRLFVAALGSNTVELIDLKQGRRSRSISGLAEPQGVLYVPVAHRLFVANRKDGSLRIFDSESLAHLKTVPYGGDADNLRYDAARRHVYLGYGDGALGELDPQGTRLREIKLDGHPESFQLEKSGGRIFANVPDAGKISVIDGSTGRETAEWPTNGCRANYPMALDEMNHRLFVVCRSPASLLVFDTQTGKHVARIATVGDSDDVFYDQKRARIYAIGGEGAIAVIQQNGPDKYAETGRIKTSPGARTGLYSPELDRLYVAQRREGQRPAAVQVYAPGR